MTSEAIASDLRTVPDSDLQKLSQNPGAVPGYLVAAEIQRRSYERSQPQGTPPGGPKPTLLSILGQNLPVDPQKPLVQTQPPAPGVMPPPTQHFAGGGLERYDGEGDSYVPPTASDDMADTSEPDPGGPVWSEKSGIPAVDLAGAVSAGLPASVAPASSPSSPAPSPSAPPTRGGLLGFLQKIAPALQYAGNVGAGMGAPGSSGLASGVGYANQVQQQEKLQNQAMVWKAMEAARENARLKLEQQQDVAHALQSGARIVAPNGTTQNAPVSEPTTIIPGLPGGAAIPGSGTVPMNPQMTASLGNQRLEYDTPEERNNRLIQMKTAEDEALTDSQIRKSSQIAADQQARRTAVADSLGITNPVARAEYIEKGDFAALKPVVIPKDAELLDPITGKITQGVHPGPTLNAKEDAALNAKAASLGVPVSQLSPADRLSALTEDTLDPQSRDDRHQRALQSETLGALTQLLRQNQLDKNAPNPAAAQFAVDQISKDPSLVRTLETEQKPIMPQVRQLWAQQHNGDPLPPPLSPDEAKNQQLAMRTMNSVATVKKLLADPDISPSIGPILGNIGIAEEKLGTVLPGRLTPEQQQKAQDLRASLTYLFLQEGKSLFGGRPPQQLMEELKAKSARPNESVPLLLGSLNATDRASRNMIGTIYQTHGQQPPSSIIPKQAGAVIYAKDPNGTIHQAAAGTKLPDGWVAVKGPQ